MARRLIGRDSIDGTHEARIYHDAEWDEYVVVIRCVASNNIIARYHTDSEQDAIATAASSLEHASINNITHPMD